MGNQVEVVHARYSTTSVDESSTLVGSFRGNLVHMRKGCPQTFAERLVECCILAGVPAAPVALAKFAGFSKQVTSKWLNGKTKNIGASDLFKLCDKLKCSSRYLWQGIGQPHVQVARDDEEIELLAHFKRLNKENKAYVLKSARGAFAEQQGVPARLN